MRFSHANAIAWTLGVTLLLSAAIVALQSLFPARAGSLVVGGAIEAVLYTSASLWLARGGRTHGSLQRVMGLSRERAPAILFVSSVLLGVFLHGPVDALQLWIESIAPLPAGQLAERLRRLAPAQASERIALFGLAALVAPFVEELFFRGALLGRLVANARVSAAVVTTSLCFTISHAEPRIWPALGVVAAALGVLRAWSVGIWPCFLLHATFNATTLAVAFFRPVQDVGPASAWTLLPALIGAALSGALLVYVGRTTRRLLVRAT